MKRKMLGSMVVSAGIIVASLLSFGCSTAKLLTPESRQISVNRSSLVLFKMTADNEIVLDAVPVIERVVLINEETSKTQTITLRSSEVEEDELGYRHHWVSVFLPPGRYSIIRIKGAAVTDFNAAPIDFPLKLQFVAEPQRITYAGNVNLTIRTRNSQLNEPYLNPTGILGYRTYFQDIPFPNGTMDVSISNEPEDLQSFRTRYPVLRNQDIKIGLITDK